MGWFDSDDHSVNAALEKEPALARTPAAAIAAPAAPPPRRPPPTSERRLVVRDRFSREVLGVAVLVVLALVCAGLIAAVVFKTQHDAAIAAQEARDYTPPPLATTAPTPTPTPTSTRAAGGGPVIAVVGDETITKAGSGIKAAGRWPALTGDALKGDVVTSSASSAGYGAQSPSGKTIGDLVAQIPKNADVVVFVGGTHDAMVSSFSIAKASTEAFGAAKTQAPDAKIVVVGPVVANGTSQPDLTQIRNVLRSATLVAKATWVDPVAAKWVPDAETTSLTDLTATDEKAIAAKLGTVVKARLK